MKSLIVATFLAAASFSFAGTIVAHDYHQVLGDIALTNACVTDGTVRSIRPTRTCATELRARHIPDRGEAHGAYTEWYCPRFESRSLEYSRHFDRTVCTNVRKTGHGETERLECASYGQRAEFLPQTIAIQVWEERGEASTWPGKTKSFTFPSCAAAQD